MRIQVEVDQTVKVAAEAHAKNLGYPSLAAMLRVITATLASKHRQAAPATPQKHYKNWPKHIRRDLETVDPELFRLFIETGLIN